MKRTLLVLIVFMLTLCSCFTSLHAFSRQCRCIQTIPHPIPRRVIRKIEVIPPSGNCRQTQVIMTRRNGSTACVNPQDDWFQKLMHNLNTRRRSTTTASSSTVAATAHL